MPTRAPRARWLTLAALVCVAAAAGCRMEEQPAPIVPPRAEAGLPERFELGRVATADQIAALDHDVNGSGVGLPPGAGDATRGAIVYREQCAVCHGARGEGLSPNPPLVGREPREGFPFADDLTLVRTVGNYWPYATTLFDYVRRTMPLTAPGSLSNEELYSVTAFLLAANEILPAGSVLDASSLSAVRMPARERFVSDDRRGGPVVR
ncbi:MAG TPA: c-type cytochrome [Gemmatimonadaceae bacterium]|nr:c-type cytochrome [Gemmatimonadaceae bacterium]